MPRSNTTARGLGWRHQQQRSELLRQTPDGTPCQECSQPMYPQSDPSSVDADHSQARSRGGTTADRLLHSACNRSRGAGHELRTSEEW